MKELKNEGIKEQEEMRFLRPPPKPKLRVAFWLAQRAPAGQTVRKNFAAPRTLRWIKQIQLADVDNEH